MWEKGTDGKRSSRVEYEYETYRNCDERKKIIEREGVEKFEKLASLDDKFEKYKDIPVPDQYLYVWEHFLNIWSECEVNMAGSRIFTFGTVKDYIDLFGYPFSDNDKKLFFKMKNWATEIVYELNKD